MKRWWQSFGEEVVLMEAFIKSLEGKVMCDEYRGIIAADDEFWNFHTHFNCCDGCDN